jgi:hypothetical protein
MCFCSWDFWTNWMSRHLCVCMWIFTIKRVPSLFFHGSKQNLRINQNAPLDFKNITWITGYKKFKLFNKHMIKIGQLECINIKWGSSCPKLWQTFERSTKIKFNETPLMQRNFMIYERDRQTDPMLNFQMIRDTYELDPMVSTNECW